MIKIICVVFGVCIRVFFVDLGTGKPASFQNIGSVDSGRQKSNLEIWNLLLPTSGRLVFDRLGVRVDQGRGEKRSMSTLLQHTLSLYRTAWTAADDQIEVAHV